MSRRLLAVALLTMVLVTSVLVAPTEAATPGKRKWLADTRHAMYGSRVYVKHRVARGGSHLAINFDIDNTTLATRYAHGSAVPVVLRLARYAEARGVTLLWNTGRHVSMLPRSVRELRRVGYHVDEICGRRTGESVPAGKRRCRAHYVAEGYTLIANVGNRSTDFVGGGYERRFKLPDYHQQLG